MPSTAQVWPLTQVRSSLKVGRNRLEAGFRGPITSKNPTSTTKFSGALQV
jgi:hypothetical protein